jgi:hypothetical protein
MELSGTITSNLRRAIDSVRRHRDRPVYPETTQYWRDLLDHARRKSCGDSRLTDALERALAERCI